jgi:hypothetical protein
VKTGSINNVCGEESGEDISVNIGSGAAICRNEIMKASII